jgi:hypothetical protein
VVVEEKSRWRVPLVGNPARVLLREDQQRREETAAKLGFSAYGLVSQMITTH